MSKPDTADRYAAWVERTPAERFPAGDDMSDLAAPGETRSCDVPAGEVARRVATARRRGREQGGGIRGVHGSAAFRLPGVSGDRGAAPGGHRMM
ncbi:MAG: hypothetical protein ACRDOL_28365 [Streptosporangiaceae bacterium]